MGACLKIYSPPPPFLSNVCFLFCRHMSWSGVQSLCFHHYGAICGCAFPATNDHPHRVHVTCVFSQSSENRNQNSPAPGIPKTPWPESCHFQMGTQIFRGQEMLFYTLNFLSQALFQAPAALAWFGWERKPSASSPLCREFGWLPFTYDKIT